MKKLLLNIAFAIASIFGLALTVTSCCKEDQPSIYGEWETVQALGYEWDYRVDKGGQFCRTLEPVFPNTTFCYDYEWDGSTLTVHAPQNLQQWIWDFECPTVAVVTIKEEGEGDYIIVLRKKQ